MIPNKLLSQPEIELIISDSQRAAGDNVLTIGEILKTGAWKEISKRFSDYLNPDKEIWKNEYCFAYSHVPPSKLTPYLDQKYDGAIIAEYNKDKDQIAQRIYLDMHIEDDKYTPTISFPINMQCKYGLCTALSRDEKIYAASISGFDLISLKDGVPEHLANKQVLFEFYHIIQDNELLRVFFYDDDREVDDGCWHYYNRNRVVEPWEYDGLGYSWAEIQKFPLYKKFIEGVEISQIKGCIVDLEHNNIKTSGESYSEYDEHRLDAESYEITVESINYNHQTKVLTIAGSTFYKPLAFNLKQAAFINKEFCKEILITPETKWDPQPIDPDNIPKELEDRYVSFSIIDAEDHCISRTILVYSTLHIPVGEGSTLHPIQGLSGNEK